MLQVEDALVVCMKKEMNNAAYAHLDLIYKPLLGNQAYSLYLTLMSIYNEGLEIHNHKLLQRTTKMSIGAIEEARKICEKFLLIRTYYSTEKGYIYELNIPMHASKFLSHEVFGRLFTQQMGSDSLQFYKRHFMKKKVSKTAYEEVSCNQNDLLKDHWDTQQEEVFQEVKTTMQENAYDFLHVIFDEHVFLDGLSELVFPKKERTLKNLRAIAEIATLYGIDEKMMRSLIKKGYDMKAQCFDAQRLKNACAKSRAEYTSTFKDPYMMPTVRFLEYKQNGVSLSLADKRLALRLMEEYHFQPEVANVIFETCMRLNDEKIVGTVVERLASSFLRLKIDNLKDAKAQMEIEVSGRKRSKSQAKKAIVQEWSQGETNVNTSSQKLLDEIQALREVKK